MQATEIVCRLDRYPLAKKYTMTAVHMAPPIPGISHAGFLGMAGMVTILIHYCSCSCNADDGSVTRNAPTAEISQRLLLPGCPPTTNLHTHSGGGAVPLLFSRFPLSPLLTSFDFVVVVDVVVVVASDGCDSVQSKIFLVSSLRNGRCRRKYL
jgi:hypothetical protein